MDRTAQTLLEDTVALNRDKLRLEIAALLEQGAEVTEVEVHTDANGIEHRKIEE